MNKNIQAVTEEFVVICETVDQVLNDWTEESNLQLPKLTEMVSNKLNWDKKQLSENDGVVRFFIKKHPEWDVVRGPHGGIVKNSDKVKKAEAKLAKAAAKAQMQALIDVKVKSATVTSDSLNVPQGLVSDEVEELESEDSDE